MPPRKLNHTFVDATPDHLHLPAAACRIATLFPDAKLVVLLKDPVQRALSQWVEWRGGRREEEWLLGRGEGVLWDCV